MLTVEEIVTVWGQGVYGNYFLFNVAVKLKLL